MHGRLGVVVQWNLGLSIHPYCRQVSLERTEVPSIPNTPFSGMLSIPYTGQNEYNYCNINIYSVMRTQWLRITAHWLRVVYHELNITPAHVGFIALLFGCYGGHV